MSLYYTHWTLGLAAVVCAAHIIGIRVPDELWTVAFVLLAGACVGGTFMTYTCTNKIIDKNGVRRRDVLAYDGLTHVVPLLFAIAFMRHRAHTLTLTGVGAMLVVVVGYIAAGGSPHVYPGRPVVNVGIVGLATLAACPP